jgi:hypothetical protein
MKLRDRLKIDFPKPLFIIEAVFVVAYVIAAALIFLFPEYLKIQSIIDLLKALVDVDGVLLGFVGIVYAQLLSSVMDQQNTLFEKMLSKPKQYRQYENYSKILSNRKRRLVIFTVATFTCLLISILASLVGIANVSKFDPVNDTWTSLMVFFPLFFLVQAIAVLVFALVGLPTEPPKPPEGQ